MTKRRKQYSPQEKGSILRQHLLDQVPISDLCDELGLAPTVFYRWQKDFFENGAAAFERKSKGRKNQDSHQTRKMVALEAKLVTKNEVLSELMEEHVQAKKANGELYAADGFHLIHATKSLITSETGATEPSYAPADW